MVIRSLAVLCLVVAFPTTLVGQEQPTGQHTANAVFLELITVENPLKFAFGRAALHYEQLLGPELGLGIGVAFDRGYECTQFVRIDPDWCDLIVVRAPVTLNRLWSDGSHRFEFGGGIEVGYSAGNHAQALQVMQGVLYSLSFRVGYRYQPTDGGLLLSATWLPRLFGNDGDILVTGLGIGYAF